MKKTLLIELCIIFAYVSSAFGADLNCTLNCTINCDYSVDTSAKKFSVSGSGAPNLTTCFEVGDGLVLTDSSGLALGQYRIRNITSLSASELFYQDEDFPSNVNGAQPDVILKRVKPYLSIYNANTNRNDWVWDSDGLYMMKDIDDPVNSNPLLYLRTYDKQGGTPEFGTFVDSDVQHHTVLAVHSLNNSYNSLMGAYVEAERHQKGICNPDVNNFSHGMKVYYSDTSECTNSPSYSRKAPVGLLSVGELDTPDANPLTYQHLSGIAGSVELKNGSSSVIENASAVRGSVLAKDGTITNAYSINARAHIDKSSNSTFNGSVTNAIGVMVEKQIDGINNYGIVLDGDGEGADIIFGSNQEGRIYSIKDGLNDGLWAGYGVNVTQISPHDPETGEWIFYSKNTKTGRTVRVNMEELVKDMEKLTGKKYLIESFVNEK